MIQSCQELLADKQRKPRLATLKGDVMLRVADQQARNRTHDTHELRVEALCLPWLTRRCFNQGAASAAGMQRASSWQLSVPRMQGMCGMF